MLPGRMKRMNENIKKFRDEMTSEKEEKTEDTWSPEAREKALEARRAKKKGLQPKKKPKRDPNGFSMGGEYKGYKIISGVKFGKYYYKVFKGSDLIKEGESKGISEGREKAVNEINSFEKEEKTEDGGPGSGIKGHTTAEEEHSKSINLPDRLKAPKEDPYSKAWNNFAELAYKELGPSWEGNVNYDMLTRKLSKEAIRRYYILYNQLK